jgi:hypothetical protein
LLTWSKMPPKTGTAETLFVLCRVKTVVVC